MSKVKGMPSQRQADCPTIDTYLQQLDRVETVARMALKIVKLVRFWFPVQGDLLASTKKFGPSGKVEIWNLAKDMERSLYPPAFARYRTCQKHMAAVGVVGIVNWIPLAFAVQELLERFDELLEELDWFVEFTGGTRGQRQRQDKTQPVAREVLDVFEQSAQHLLDVIEDGRQQYQEQSIEFASTGAPSLALPAPGAKKHDRKAAKKQRGRKSLSPAQLAKRESLVADWQQFKNGRHGQKKDFCADRGLGLRSFDNLLAAHRTQRRRDQESNRARTN